MYPMYHTTSMNQQDATDAQKPRTRDNSPSATPKKTEGRVFDTTLRARGTPSSSTKKTASKRKNNASVIPILRTYEGDSLHIARTKGGAELRSILAKEAEEKRKAQEEYRQKTKDILKESVILKDAQRNFSKKQQERSKKKTAPVSRISVDKKHIADSVSGALAYLQSAQQENGEESRDAERVLEKQQGDDKPLSAYADILAPGSEGKPPSTQQQSLGASVVQHAQEQSPDQDTLISDVVQEDESDSSDGVRPDSSPKKVFTEEERQMLRDKQEESVEKQGIREAWQSFETKREELKEKGFEARDVRSYGADPTAAGNSALRKQNITAILVIVGLIIVFLVVIFSIVSGSDEAPGTISSADLRPVPDAITSENQVLVDMTTAPEGWNAIGKNQGSIGIVNKFVPYALTETGSVQLTLPSLFAAVGADVPLGLLDTFDSYYFAGNYRTKTTTNGVFIVSVENYGDALVWMLNWERYAFNAFAALFPDTLSPSAARDVSVATRVIDNKDIRVLSGENGGTPLLYYFFNRSLLVFIVGGEDIVPIINNRIRSANA